MIPTLPASRHDPMVTRLRRIVAMLVELQHTPATRPELAARYGVSERQISADITLLRLAGVHVQVKPYRVKLQGPSQVEQSGEAATPPGRSPEAL